MKRAILIPIIILFFLSSCDTAIQVKEGRVHLIIVALDYSNTNYVSNLIGPIDDAKEIGACLESHYTERNIPFEAVYLMAEGSMANEKDECYPSAENIISVIQNLTVHKEDLIVFYYSGHGALYEDSESKAYLVTGMTGGIPNGLYQDNNELSSSWYQTMLALGYNPSEISNCLINQNPYTILPLDTLYKALDEIGARSIAIIDSCNSGAMTMLSPPLISTLQEVYKDTFLSEASYRHLSVLTSSTEAQTSRVISFLNEDNIQERHSLFTSDLLSILGWHHSSTKTTISSQGLINGYIEESISNVSIRDLWNDLENKSSLNQTYTSSFSGLDTILIP